MAVCYIGADMHSSNTELAVEQKGRIVQRHSVATTVQAIREVLETLDGRKHLAMEEGPLAGWLYRELIDHVDSLVVCDPAPGSTGSVCRGGPCMRRRLGSSGSPHWLARTW